MEKPKVKAEPIRKCQTMHFGSLMALYHEKNSQLPPDKRSYKGRVVCRGDTVKDESGNLALFNEQGAGASQMSAAKLLDAIARMPCMNG